MSLRCRCRWRNDRCALSPAFAYFLASFVVLGSIASLYGWLIIAPGDRTALSSSSFGCREDNEGSWSIGVFYGDSPFSLKPIESVSLNLFSNLGFYSFLITPFFWFF